MDFNISKDIKKLEKLLSQSQNLRIVSHRNPDGDSLGSMLSFANICEYYNLSYDLYIIDPIPDTLLFLVENYTIKVFNPNDISEQLLNEQTDMIIFLDCGQINRIGNLYDTILPHQTIINIDHHISNTLFGDLNIVLDITSTCELLYYIIQELYIPLTYNLAQQLYVGVLTDTNKFQYEKVNAQTHSMLANLLEYGISPTHIYQLIYQSYPIEWFSLLQKALAKIELYHNNSIAIIPFSLQDFQDIPNNFDDTNILMPIIAMSSAIQVYIIIKEKDDGTIAASLRSKNNLDVSKIAQFFQGGGHKHAAGCRTKNLSLIEFKQELLQEINKNFT